MSVLRLVWKLVSMTVIENKHFRDIFFCKSGCDRELTMKWMESQLVKFFAIKTLLSIKMKLWWHWQKRLEKLFSSTSLVKNSLLLSNNICIWNTLYVLCRHDSNQIQLTHFQTWTYAIAKREWQLNFFWYARGNSTYELLYLFVFLKTRSCMTWHKIDFMRWNHDSRQMMRCKYL